MAHTLIAARSIEKGLNKLILNQSALNSDLQKNVAVLAEAIQTILRREGFAKPYEALKELTRGNQHVSLESIHAFINGLDVSNTLKEELKSLRPEGYTGIIRF